jgi:hypothetical protein
MKKLLLFFTLIFSLCLVNAQVLSEDFETTSAGGSWPNGWTTSDNSWTINDPTTGTPGYTGNTTIVEPSGTSAMSGNCTNVYAVVDSDGFGNAGTQNTDLISPVMDFSTYNVVSLDFNHSFRVYANPVANVEATTDGGATWTILHSYDGTISSYGAQTHDISALGGNAAVQIRFHYEGAWDYWWAIDDIVISGSSVSCVIPVNLSAANVTSSSTDLTWAAGGTETEWNISYGVAGFTAGTGTQLNTTATSYALTGLTSYTDYDIYVQSVCNAATNDTSGWAGPVNIFTCPGSAPVLETFNSVTSMMTSATAPCWSQSSNDVFDWLSNSGGTASAPTGPSDDVTGGGTYMYIETSVPRAAGDSAILISPSIDISSLSSAELSFYSHMFGASIGMLNVDVSGDNGSTFTNVVSKSGDQGDQWMQEVVQIPSTITSSVIVRFTATVGDDGAGVAYWSDIAIDNFEIRQASTCPQPSGGLISNVLATSADAAWTPGGSETAWNIEYGAAGFALGSGTNMNVTTPNYSITGLAPTTDYDFYVQGVCSASDQSYWYGPLSFTTLLSAPICGDSFGPYCYGPGSFTVFTSVVSTPGDFITIDFTAGETEAGYDYLQIYDGVGPNGNLLYDMDGDHTGVSVLSLTGTLTVYISGDGNWNCVDGIGGPYVPIEATISCSTPSAIDMEGVAMTTSPSLILANGPFTISGDLKNMGTSTVTSMDINYSIDGGAAVAESVSGLSLGTGDSYSFNHGTTWNPTAGTYDIAIWATNINGSSDMNTANDMASGTVTVFANGDVKRPMLESFTSSTCGPCVAGNANVATVTSAYTDDQYSILKYQMSWPGSGDPYYTDEGGDRRTYYNVNAVPDLVLDGNVWQGNSSSLTNAEVDGVMANPAFISLSSYHSVNGQTVDVSVTINPLGDFTNTLTMYSAIFEYSTFNNVGTNGETQFDKVMKKMIPSSSGFSISGLQSGVVMTENLSHTFQGSYTLPADAGSPIDHTSEHSVEDFSNLGVVTWIQDDASKEIIQSTVSSLSATSIEEKPIANLMIFPNPAENLATVAIEGIMGENVIIELYNLLGELIISENYTSQSDFDSYNLDITHLNNGMYNVILKVGESISSKKLQVIK